MAQLIILLLTLLFGDGSNQDANPEKETPTENIMPQSEINKVGDGDWNEDNG